MHVCVFLQLSYRRAFRYLNDYAAFWRDRAELLSTSFGFRGSALDLRHPVLAPGSHRRPLLRLLCFVHGFVCVSGGCLSSREAQALSAKPSVNPSLSINYLSIYHIARPSRLLTPQTAQPSFQEKIPDKKLANATPAQR